MAADRFYSTRARQIGLTAATAASVTDEICDRCHATLATYADACSAPLDEICPGFEAVERLRAFANAKAEGRA